VSKRAQQLALLGVLGLSACQRLALVLWESLALAAAPCSIRHPLAVGAARQVAMTRRRVFLRVAPDFIEPGQRRFDGRFGVISQNQGAWWPARQAQQLPLVMT
jgi:putative ABC transport system permease protein